MRKITKNITMINKRFTTKFANNRMVWDGEYSEIDEANEFYGHIQQMSAELSQSLALTFTKAYTIWCPLNTDVEQGDVITNSGNSYNVKAIKDLLVGSNKHKQLFVEKEESYG